MSKILLIGDGRTAMTTEIFLNVEQAAEMLQINKFTLYRWSEQGKIPSRKFGARTLRFLFSDIEEFTRKAVTPCKA